MIEALALCHLVKFTEHDVIASIELHRLHHISFWDAVIVRAARAIVLYSEDLAHGTTIAGARVENQFGSM